MSMPANFYSDSEIKDGSRRVVAFTPGEILLEHGAVQRIDFSGTRCNLTLRNGTAKRLPVNVKIWVLNRSLIELWSQTEKWSLTSLQPDQSHIVSWEFKPAIPPVVWNTKARQESPEWIVIDVI